MDEDKDKLPTNLHDEPYNDLDEHEGNFAKGALIATAFSLLIYGLLYILWKVHA